MEVVSLSVWVLNRFLLADVFQVESFILDQEDIEDGDSVLDTSKFLLASENLDGSDLRSVDPETQAKLEALLEAAGKCIWIASLV